MFSGEYVITDPLIHDKIVSKTFFLCIIYRVTNAVAVIYSRNMPMAEQRIVCFQSKKVIIYRLF